MIVWIDTETTGLDEREGHLLEVALVVTDDDLNEVSYYEVIVRPVGEEIENVRLPDVVREMHEKNGLLRDVREHGLRRYEGEQKLVEFVQNAFKGVPDVATGKCSNCKKRVGEHSNGFCLSVTAPQVFTPVMISALSQTPLAGSTVSFDRRWIRHHMPSLEKLFSYRSIDVSSFTEMADRWSREVYESRPRSTDAHRALSDARGSIEILRHYRSRGFVGGRPSTEVSVLRAKVGALEEVAGDIFDDLVGHTKFSLDGGEPIPVSQTYVAPLAVALFSTDPVTGSTDDVSEIVRRIGKP